MSNLHFEPIDTAPANELVQVVTKAGFVLKARLQSGFVNELGKDVLGWVADEGQEYPECWDDGVCWESNSAGLASDYPVQWRPLKAPSDGDSNG